ncbi:MAG: aldolase/citrate lyase family protein [Bryobacteraceae bacterium]|jgi:4-hydroxy-2-oxoheptanedioate aldolase
MITLNKRLSNKAAIYGVFAKTNDPFFIEILGKAGFDFVVLDSEHGPNAPRDMYPLVLASWLSGLLPVVRVGTLSDTDIARALDLGVAGVQVPQLSTVEQARQAVQWSRFAPQGSRGVCRYVRAADFSLQGRAEYFEHANEIAVIGMVEGVVGIRNLDEILQVDGIDVLFIGPYDLSQALGVIGDVENPRVLKEIEMIVAKCKARNRTVGTFVDTIASAKRYKDLGVQYLAYSVDVGIFAEACRGINNDLRTL